MVSSLIELENLTTYKVDIEFLENITKTLNSNYIELIICNNDYIQKVNLTHRSKDTATDVLSFPYENEFNIPNLPLGSILISIDFVIKKAKELNHSTDDELALLFIHGLLHLLGFDHEIDNGEHREKEQMIIKQFNLPDSLIVRTKSN